MTIYLYVKQCSHCGLKYFGKTIRNPYKYHGSGNRWLLHIKKHGKEHIITLEVFKFEDQVEATSFALQFSEYNCIVEYKSWANEKPENALDGWVQNKHHTEETKRKLSEINKGKQPWCTGKKLSEEHKQKISEGLRKGKKPGRKPGFKQTEFQKQKMKEISSGHKMGNEQRKILYSPEIIAKRVATRMKNRNGKYNS